MPLGWYELPRRMDDAHIYRVAHPLAEAVIASAKGRELPPAEITFTLEGKVSALEQYVGSGGALAVDLLRVASLGQIEEHLILAAVADNGDVIDGNLVQRLLGFPAHARPIPTPGDTAVVDRVSSQRQSGILQDVGTRNLRYFEEETDKLDSWADDLKNGLEREIKEIDREIMEARKQAKAALTLEQKLTGQRTVKALESKRSSKRRSLFEAQDEIDARRDALIADIEDKLKRQTETQRLFAARWRFEI